MKKRKLKLKQKVIGKLKIVGVILAIVLGAYIFYCSKLNDFTDLGYSRKSSKVILFGGYKDYVLSIKYSETLDAAFESDNFNEKYMKNYSKISYFDHKNLIKNINKLLAKGYSNSDISIILAHGNDEDISEFTKRERVKYLEEFYEYPYAKIKYYDRYLAYTDETGEDEKTTVIHVNLNMDKKEYEDAKLVENFSVDMLINKFNYLEEDFVPDELEIIPEEYTNGEELKANSTALYALSQMIESAKVDGLELRVSTAYRDYNDQNELAEFYRKWYGDKYVETYVAKPGFTEHQTGLAFDLASASKNVFAESKEYEWVRKNAHKYGFILRFPDKAESITGYKYEPWHYRYVGKEIAEYIYKNNITFEEYYVLFLDK